MAKVITETTISDLDGSPDAHTVRVSLDFAVDLNDAQAADLDALLQLMEVFRVAASGQRPVLQSAAPKKALPSDSAKGDVEERKRARVWLNSNGYNTPAVGRISAEHWEAWKTRTPAAGYAAVEIRNAVKAVKAAPAAALAAAPPVTFSAPEEIPAAVTEAPTETPVKATRAKRTTVPPVDVPKAAAGNVVQMKTRTKATAAKATTAKATGRKAANN